MSYQLHDSQINRIEFGENAIVFNFSQGFWRTNEQGKMIERLNNGGIAFEIEGNNVPIQDFISIRISKDDGAYKTVPLKKFMRLLKKSPFDIHLEYDCDFARSKMFQLHSNHLRISAELFIKEICNVKYIHD